MNALLDPQILFKTPNRRTESFLENRPRLSHGSARGMRTSSFNQNRLYFKPKEPDLNSTKDSTTPLHLRKKSLNLAQHQINSRPCTAHNNKQRLKLASSNEKYKLNINVLEEFQPNVFGLMVKKIHTPINLKTNTILAKVPSENFSDRNVSNIHNYLIGKEIGKGAYATVKLAIHKTTKRKVAIKIYEKIAGNDPNKVKNAQREVKILKNLDHPNIVKMIESIETPEFIYVVLEYIHGYSLQEYVKQKPGHRLEESDAEKIFHQLVEALEYCHSNNVTHRDIKFDNILIDTNNKVKLIDFGFSTQYPNEIKTKTFCGTPSYMAPEIVKKIEYQGPPVDIWACGVVLFGLVCGSFPFRAQSDKECYKRILSGTLNIPDFVADRPKKIIEMCLQNDPAKRITAKNILNDCWFQKNSHVKGENFEDNADALVMNQLVRSI